MVFAVITVREEIFPESHCWILEECTMRAFARAGWQAEPWVQKIVRLPPAEFIYHTGAYPKAPATEPPNFLLIEVLLPVAKSSDEKEAFWVGFRTCLETKLPSLEADLALRFVEMPNEKVFYHRKDSSRS
jgi:hypothetical protein